jgi:hypothetical protein
MKLFVRVAACAALLAAVAPATADEVTCQITFRVGTSTQLFSVAANPSYADAPGEFKGQSTLIECEALNSSIVSVGDADLARGLAIGIVGSPTPISGPKDVLRCTWLPSSRLPVAGDFDMSEQTAFTTGFQEVHPDFHISDIECDGVVGSTTTTTELPPAVCGDFDENGKVAISDALAVLRTAVGVLQCAPCVCDVDGNGSVSISDALVVLRIAVGQNPNTNCSDC